MKTRTVLQTAKSFFALVMVLTLVISGPGASIQPVQAAATITSITPLTWNVIGLDSNNVSAGPENFPVGARICYSGVTGPTTITSTFVWDSVDAYINLRSGSNTGYSFSVSSDGCTDVYYEVAVTRDPAAYNHTRRYYITATPDGGTTVNTLRPRELFVERLVSQSRNYNFNLFLSNTRPTGTNYGTSIPAGGEMNLTVGQTYFITLESKTATNGYEQIESFINFPNTIFQVLSVSSTYTAFPAAGKSTSTLYYDACTWENDPGNPYYRSCLDVGKAGGNIVNTYEVKIISGGGSSQTLNNLVYDFSGSSYHYNSDYSASFRTANIIDPNAVTFSKIFSPDPMNVNGSSVLTFTIHNPNGGAVSGVSFSDTFPTTPGLMTVASPTGASTSGCGTPTYAPVAGAGSIAFSGGSIAANSTCTVKVNVVVSATGTYSNTSDPLWVDGINTGKTAAATVDVNTDPPQPAPTCGVELAAWDFTAGTTTYTRKSSLVSTISNNIYNTLLNGSGVGPATTGGSNAWWGNNWIITPPGTTAPYYEFILDTSKFIDRGFPGYQNVSMTFDMYLYDNWANAADNHIYVYTGTDGGGTSQVSDFTNITKTQWYTGRVTIAANTGNQTTTFRIYGIGAQKDYSRVYIDNVVFRGCAVPVYPSLEKTFLSNPIAKNGSSTLRFTLTNPNNVVLTGVSFSDSLPTGINVADSGPTSVCGGSLTTTSAIPATSTPAAITFSGGTLNAYSSCTIPVTVTGTAVGTHQNTSGFISSTQSGINSSASGFGSASLTVLAPPTIEKVFSPNPIPAGGTSTLTFTITNPNGGNDISGVTFNDTFPAGMVVASPLANSTTGCGTPTFSPTAGDGAITFTNGAIAAGGTCIVKVDVTAPSAGSYPNTSGAVSALTAGTGNTASDTLGVTEVKPGIAILKRISTSASGPWYPFISVAAGSPVYYQFLVENTGDTPLTNVSVSDPLMTVTCPLTTLAKYEIMVCTASTTALAGDHDNTATASGTYGSNTYTSLPSTASYGTTGISIDKVVLESAFAGEGDKLHYNFIVTNSGFYPLKNPITVNDPKITNVICPSTTEVGDKDLYLDPGEAANFICTAEYTVTAADVALGSVTNTASASATVANSTAIITSTIDTAIISRANTDYGDLPSGYAKTLQGADGARHTIGTYYLGSDVTPETNGTEDPAAKFDVDDGVTRRIGQQWQPGNTVNIDLVIGGPATKATAQIGLWIDWNGNDTDYTTLDFIDCGSYSTGTTGTCVVTIPGTYDTGTPIFARVRLFDPSTYPFSTRSLQASDYFGLANNGEVEDYKWEFGPTSVDLVNFSAHNAKRSITPLALAASITLGLLAFALILHRRPR